MNCTMDCIWTTNKQLMQYKTFYRKRDLADRHREESRALRGLHRISPEEGVNRKCLVKATLAHSLLYVKASLAYLLIAR